MIHSKKFNNYENILSSWLCFIVIPFNLLGDYLLKVTGIQPLMFNRLTSAIYIAMFAILNKKIKLDKEIAIFLGVNCCIMAEHLFMFGNVVKEFKHLLYVLIFVACASVSTINTYNYFKKIVLVFSIFMIFDALLKSRTVAFLGYRMFNIRNFTILDKPYYTELFALATVILFNELLKVKDKKKTTIYIVWIAAMMYTLFFLFQSKMGVVAVCMAFIGEFFIIQKKFRRKMSKIVAIAVVAFIVYILFIPYEIPDYILALLSFLGLSSSSVNAVYYDTYSHRLEILGIVFQIFKTFPIFGVGFGNYYNYVSANNLQKLTSGIRDVESSFFALFAEGGVTYFIVTCFLWIVLYKRIRLNLKISPEIVGTFICMVVLLCGNDFMNLFYWIWIGIYWRISKNDYYLKTVSQA